MKANGAPTLEPKLDPVYDYIHDFKEDVSEPTPVKLNVHERIQGITDIPEHIKYLRSDVAGLASTYLMTVHSLENVVQDRMPSGFIDTHDEFGDIENHTADADEAGLTTTILRATHIIDRGACVIRRTGMLLKSEGEAGPSPDSSNISGPLTAAVSTMTEVSYSLMSLVADLAGFGFIPTTTGQQAQTLLHAVINECRVDSSIQVLALQRVGLKTIIEVMDLIREKIV